MGSKATEKRKARRQRAALREKKYALPPERESGPLRLGVDVQVSYRDLQYFRDQGFEVVVRAKAAETDESWVERAHAARADVICSNDRGVRALAWKLGMLWIDIPAGMKRGQIRHTIASRAQQMVAQELVELAG